MTYTFKLSRRIARLRAPLFAVILLASVGCNSSDAFDPGSTSTPTLATSFAGGIPMGTFAQPTSEFGSRYNGAMRTIGAGQLLEELAAIKSRGGRVVLMFAGPQNYYKNSDGTFSFSKWQDRIDNYRGVNFSSYVTDGTVIGHYIIDEPYDPANWAGQPIPGSTIDQMAKYSKSIWPNMATIVRAEPSRIRWSGKYQYLDAAWAQFENPRGLKDINEFIRDNVADAQQMGLALVVGLNISKGAPPLIGPGQGGSPMTPDEVRNWGGALLSSSYPCAFISWQYEDQLLSSSGMGSAMDYLRDKAQNRASKACRYGATSEPPPSEPPPPPPPSDTTTPEPPPPPPTTVSGALPFGLEQAPVSEYTTRWTGSVYKATPSQIADQLSKAAAAQTKLIVMLGVTSQVKNANGTFSLTKWKAAVDQYRSLSLGSRITGGTFYLHYLVDQPQCSSCWGGQAIPWATVEEMAKYSKAIWPGLATVARVAPTDLAKATFAWTYLDAGWAQYNTKKGDLGKYLSAQVASARAERLGLVAGLNADDASGVNTAPMTASQIKQFGTKLASEPAVCALAVWKYDAGYLAQTGIRAAFDSVATLAKSRSAASCVVN
ncbi:MAG TPA: hypothetical protein VJQ44_16305 [Gemmatimonadales bacterium]|nr:hypothetical protein [Gemmatimonadales bacterium]